METIHIDKYDAAKPDDTPADAPPRAQEWRRRLRDGASDLGREVGATARRALTFVKSNPGATAVAALGVGLFAARGKHRLLKAAYGAFAIPYLKRHLTGAPQPAG